MKKTARAVALVAIAAGLAAGGALAARSMTMGQASGKGTVQLRKTKLGPVLVTSKGHTLYLFGRDRGGKSSCTGTCLTYWPAYVVHGKPSAGSGVKAKLLGTTRRANGSMQVTYNKHPLYTFAEDKRPGQTNGEGMSAFGAKWYVVSAKGKAVLKAPPSGTTTATTTTTPTYTCAYPPC